MIDMHDFGASAASVARPWLSIAYNATSVGMADVDGSVVVVTANASMCAVLEGAHSVNISVAVDCQVVAVHM
jgi:hypothetical protein